MGTSAAKRVQFSAAVLGAIFVAAGTIQQDDALAGAMFACVFSFPYLVYLAVGQAYQGTKTPRLALRAAIISGTMLITTSMLLHGFLFSRVPGSSTDGIAAVCIFLFQALVAAPLGFLVTGRH